MDSRCYDGAGASKKCNNCEALNHWRKKGCGDCKECETFTPFTKVSDTAIQVAEEDDSSDEDEEAPAEGDDNSSESDADGAKRDDSSSESDDDGAERDDSSSESDDDEGEPSNVYLERNQEDKERGAAAREIINSTDLGLVPFVPGPKSLARRVQTEGVPSVGDIVDRRLPNLLLYFSSHAFDA